MTDYRIKITGDESRPSRRRYKWQVYEFYPEGPLGNYPEGGWWQAYEDDWPRPLEGYAKTMRAAEEAARHTLVPLQITAPADPTLVEPHYIEIQP